MRISFFLYFMSIFQLFATSNYAQNKKLTILMENAKISRVLLAIEDQSDFKFFYNNQLVDMSTLVDVNIKKKKIWDVLDLVLHDAGITYRVVGKQVALFKGDPNDLKKQQTITGVVTDENGATLPGVSIAIKGTSKGTVTGSDGKYSIPVVPDATLVFSFVGMLTQEIEVGNQTVINVTMVSDAIGIAEVVAIGYGTMKKENLTGSVASVGSVELLTRPVTNATSMLQGRLSGVSLIQNSGGPGSEGLSIRIRGQGTYSGAGSNPLILIDGVPGSMSGLNPRDIKSVSVLKDAASAAIYGSRAANGVILVTTDDGSGIAGIKVMYNYNFGIHTPTKMLDVIDNSAEYMEMWNTARNNSFPGSTSGLYPQSVIDLYSNAADRVKYPNANWLDIMFNPAHVQIHHVSVIGGNEKTHYNLSLGATDQPGTMRGFDYQKYNARLNIGSQVSEKLKVGINIGLKQSTRREPRNGQQDAFLSTLSQAPTYNPTLPDGSGRYTDRAYDWEENNDNQFGIAEQAPRFRKEYELTSQIWSDFEIMEGLNWYVKAAANISFFEDKFFAQDIDQYMYHEPYRQSKKLGVGSLGLLKQKSHNIFTNLYSYLQYDKNIGNHQLGIMAGYSQEENNYEFLEAYRQSYPKPELQEINAGSADTQKNWGSSESWSLMSGFARLQYNFMNKYLLESNVRYDGTSRLHKDHRWGIFPSVSMGWRISEEQFMQDIGWLDNLKLRASWGQLGNQNIGLYPYQALLNYTGNYPFNNSSLSTGVAQSGLSNELITWESTTILDFGFDITLWDHLSLVFDWYVKETNDILRSAQVTKVVGLSAPVVNSGAMKNTGFDLSINYNNTVKSGTFSGLLYNAGFVFQTFNNKIVKFGAVEKGGREIREEGRPWNTHYMLEWIGIFQDEAEVAAHPSQFGETLRPGDLKFKDQLTVDTDGDGIPDEADGVINWDDRIPIEKGTFADFEYSFNFNLEWKGFDVACFFQGVEGRKIYTDGWGIVPFRQGSVPTTEWRNAWTPGSGINDKPKLYYADQGEGRKVTNYASTYFLQDASYLRLKNLQVGYTLPEHLTSKLDISKVRVYFSGDNLLTFTKYFGLDPERARGGTLANYPQNKIISFGINVEF